MKKKIFLTVSFGAVRRLGVVCAGMVCVAGTALAEDGKPAPEPAKLEFQSPTAEMYAGKEWSGLREDAVIEISDKGLNPDTLDMKVRQGILFFYNATKGSQIKFEIDFGKNMMVCYSSATPNLAFQGDGKLVSTRAVAPGNFASTCFPNIGTYAFRVYGVDGRKGPLQGKITVLPRAS